MSTPRKLRRWPGAVVLLILSACCSPRLTDLDAYRALSLGEKIARYETAIANRCVYSEKLRLLSAIAVHGSAAADAMAAELDQARPDFPLDDALTVLELARSHADLRNHEAMRALARIADTHPDQTVRQRATEVMNKITSAQ